MSDKQRPRDIWKDPPTGSEGDAAADFESPTNAQDEADAHAPKDADAARGYEPKHRAPGRAPLIRRRRARLGEEETVSWETPWTDEPPEDPAPSRWTDEEEPSVTPPPRPIEDVPYLGPRRSELRKKRARPSELPETDPSSRSREYTGRHLAPKKPRWSRGPEGDATDGAAAEREATMVEGDVDRAEEHVAQVEEHEAQAEEHEAQAEEQEAQAEEQEAQAEEHDASRAEEHDASRAEEHDASRAEEHAPRALVAPAAEEQVGDGSQAPEEVASEAATGSGPAEVDTGGPADLAAALRDAAARTAPDSVSTGGDAESVEPDRGARPAAHRPLPSAPVEPTAVHPPQAAAPQGDAGSAADPPLAKASDKTTDDDGTAGEEDASLATDEDSDTSTGPRRAALQERKKKKRVLQGALAALAVLAGVAGVIGAGLLVKEVVDEPQQRATVPFDQPEEERVGGTTLIFGTKEGADSARGAIWMVLLSVDPETEKASVVYVPAHTAVEVPGRGLQGVGEAYGSGGIPLLLVSAENLLGIKIDRYVELSDKDALVLFEQFDTLTVDVPAEVRVPAGRDRARLIFVEGPQEMTPATLVRLLYTTGMDGDDVELGSRHLAFWDQLLDVYDDPAELADAFEAAGAALGESDASAQEHATFVEALAATPAEDVTITALPVRPISAGDSQLYSVDAEELTAFVEETIGTPEGAEQEVRVQLLNGNGVPGIGREAAAKLVGEGFRVILGGNARRLDYRKTLVIAYDSSDRGIALAERAKDLLGVGEVQVSAQQQGIVDLTIVVGKDFLRAR